MDFYGVNLPCVNTPARACSPPESTIADGQQDSLFMGHRCQGSQEPTTQIPKTGLSPGPVLSRKEHRPAPTIQWVDTSDILKELADAFDIDFNQIDHDLRTLPIVLHNTPEAAGKYQPPATPILQHTPSFAERAHLQPHPAMLSTGYSQLFPDRHRAVRHAGCYGPGQHLNAVFPRYLSHAESSKMMATVDQSAVPAKARASSKKPVRVVLQGMQRARILEALAKRPYHFGFYGELWKPEYISVILDKHFQLEFPPDAIRTFLIRHLGVTLADINQNALLT